MINGELIKQKRIERKLSQEELAKLCGYADKSVICHLEKGDVNDIPLSKAVQLAKALKVTPTELSR